MQGSHFKYILGNILNILTGIKIVVPLPSWHVPVKGSFDPKNQKKIAENLDFVETVILLVVAEK